ncbi:hypothetical protein M0813_03289 [Anaeramoeba flamelloides]|uniref:Uncharacterized protein n=1 Tax=Anaeramoeba flamelloides TaxID=1746091 RepID=A0ABQ8Y0J5_9EUKA|nr:hypothetical protein M0813_03289 [Anaeramoeba flamelloides]
MLSVLVFLLSPLINIYLGERLCQILAVVFLILTLINAWDLIKTKRKIFQEGFFQALFKEILQEKFFFLFVLLLLPLFWYLFDVTTLKKMDHTNKNKEEQYSLFSVKNSWSDLPFHLNIISSFVVGCNKGWGSLFDLKFPIYSGEKLKYSFLIDFHTAILHGCCQEYLRTIIIVTGVCLVFSFLVLYYSFLKRIFANGKRIVIFSMLFVLFSGGSGFVQYIHNYPDTKLAKYDYVHQIGEKMELFWIPFIDGILLPQRTVLIGYPAVLIVFTIFFHLLSNLKRHLSKKSPKLWIFSALVTSALPLTHMHCFVAVLFIVGSYFIIFSPIFQSKPKKDHTKGLYLTNWLNYLRPWLIYFLIVFLISLPQIYYLIFHKSQSRKLLTFNPIWSDETKNVFLYLFQSLGLIIPLSVISMLTLSNIQKRLYLPFLFLLLICLLIRFTPWKYDNIKIINICFFLILASIINFADTIFQRLRSKKILKYLFCIFILIIFVLSLFSSVLSLIAVPKTKSQLFSKEDINFGNAVINLTDHNSIFLQLDFVQHKSPITTIAGRQLFVGYPGWVWSHGLDIEIKINILKKILTGEKKNGDWKSLSKDLKSNNITHLVTNPKKMPLSNSFINYFNLKIIYSDTNYVLYELTAG